jgi:hypothetical protein
MSKIELLYKNVGSKDRHKTWKFWKYTTHTYYAWSHALVPHVWVGHETMGLKCVNPPTSYIIMRVDATRFRSLFLNLSTLAVGEFELVK